MQDRENLTNQLEAMREPKWIEKRINKLARWPGKKREALRVILSAEHWSYYEVSRDDHLERVIRYFDGLDDAQRGRLFDGLFPKLGTHVERAWRDAGNRPYQLGYERFPFRASRRAETLAESRAWFFALICETLRGLDQDAEWLAAWGPHLPTDYVDPRVTGWLLGAVLRGGGADADAVRAVLRDSINGEHEIGKMGYHAVVALLNSAEREDWENIGKLLVAARRQEGLRQAILEAVDEAHPEAFRYMLGVILEHDLGRFSATVRAFDVWLGMQWAGGSAKVVHDGIRRLTELFDDEEERQRAIRDGEPEDLYLALWVTAFEDAERALELAAPVLAEATPERRYAAFIIIERIRLLPEFLELPASRLVSGDETDPRLQMATAGLVSRVQFTEVSDELFKTMAELFDRLPAKRKMLEPLVWPWARYALDRRTAARALAAMAVGSPEKLIPYAQALETWDCVHVIGELAGTRDRETAGTGKQRKRRRLTPETRKLMLDLVGDNRRDVQKAAFEAIKKLPVKEDEVEVLLGLLHRSAPALRTGAIGRLSKLGNARAVEVAGELLGDRHSKKQAAGLELARHLIESNRSKNKALKLLRERRESVTETELRKEVDRLLGQEPAAVSLDDCLGLVPPGSRSPLPKPRFDGVRLETDAAKVCLKGLADVFLQHAETEVEVKGETSRERVLLASAAWRFPVPRHDVDHREDAKERLPLCETWITWLNERSEASRDPDGLEWVRAWAWTERGESYSKLLPTALSRNDAWKSTRTFLHLVEWMLVLSAPKGGGKLLVQYFEDALARSSPSAEEKKEAKQEGDYGSQDPVVRRCGVPSRYFELRPSDFTQANRARLARLLMLALERGSEGCENGPSLELFAAAYDLGELNEADLVWLLLHPRATDPKWGARVIFGPIRDATTLRGAKEFEERPKLAETVQTMRDRLIEVELTRGDRMTPASLPATELRHAGGADNLFRLVAALGRDKLVRHHEWGDPTRRFSLSRLISVTSPGKGDTTERFVELYEKSNLKPSRLLELAVFAPQWAGQVENALEVEGLEDAIWWIHAHTKQSAYWRDQEFRDLWAARISERTEVEADDLEEGAVDVAWFKRVLGTVGMDGWDRLQKPAKYASNSGGHKRAQLFADAMLSHITTTTLLARIDEKRHQDSVRALGLVPLPGKKVDAKKEVLARYARLQEFKRESRKFGSQRQASEGRAVEIGMQNLARTAGYRDPRRLQWAMEAEAVTDLAAGPVTVTVDETSVSLAITQDGDPEIGVVKKGRALKNVPAKLRKHERVAKLRARVPDLRRQRSRMRQSLEESMCRGDCFCGTEVQEFFAHPMLRPMVERLIFIGDAELIGYPERDGHVLRSHEGSVEVIATKDSLRLAHPVDLLSRGDWSSWQHECFAVERVQPFKQIFRETYPKTAGELDDCDFTRRYAGHQVNPKQALALLKRRHWVAAPEEGVRKTFHDEGLIAEVWFQEYFYTPADVEDLTLEGITFVKRGGDYKRVPIADVPERLFSETMRDLDLVVSVAHAGGVDPEASASTVEMRATLVQETCRLLGLANARVDGHHVLIDGTKGSYSVHLGSATTTILPGRVLLIAAVHSQYRGRLFLPFADDDPKTAEVLSKTLLLARDDEIKDPSILDQIRR